jgi:SAM-dependent methyltransferase
MTSLIYPGNELELFKFAINWKRYFSNIIKPYIHGDVLEVGAGNGSTTELFLDKKFSSWTCLEPDPNLSGFLRNRTKTDDKFSLCDVISGTIYDINTEKKFDVILYIDVLEHINDDAGEINKLAGLIKPGGILVVLSPSYQWLFSEFDKSIGHYRRYTGKSLAEIMPVDFHRLLIKYLDSVGVLASLLNRLLLHQSIPSYSQIKFWDNVIVRLSEWFDRLVFHSFGKSVLAIYQKK